MAFEHQTPGLESPASLIAGVHGSDDDSVNLPFASRALAVEVSGEIRLTTVDGFTGTITVVRGAPFPIRVRKIWATGTTAEGIVALA